MIKFRIFAFENEIIFDDNYINILEISNKSMFKHIVYTLNKLVNDKDVESEEFLLEENSKVLSFSNDVLMIYDCFNIDFNDSKFIKHIYTDIENIYKMETEGWEELQKYYNYLLTNINKILVDYDYELECKSQVQVKDILKAVGLKFNMEYYDKPLENLICLFDLVSTFKLYKVLILANAKCFFNNEELEQLYRAAKYRDINVLFIESQVDNNLKLLENKLYVDEDFDEFILKK